jgi:hypothetical protein
MSAEQRLNTVDRFRKHPGRLVLEEHGHCEVPAGCGGVVLRWRNPLAGLPLTVHLYAPVTAGCFIDGKQLQTTRIDVAPGRHVLAVVLDGVELAAAVLLVAATFEPRSSPRTLPSDPVERPLKVLSAADGTWKFSLDAPADDGWKTPDFDDAAWPALAPAADADKVSQATDAYQGRHCAHLGAEPLGIPPRKLKPVTGTIYIRKSFIIPAPQAARAGS